MGGRKLLYLEAIFKIWQF